MGAVSSQITSLTIVYSTVYSGADQRKHQRSASLAFVREMHRWPMNSPHKWPIKRKMFLFDDVIMQYFFGFIHNFIIRVEGKRSGSYKLFVIFFIPRCRFSIQTKRRRGHWHSAFRLRRCLKGHQHDKECLINSLAAGNTIWRLRSWPIFIQMMTCDGTKPLPEPVLT